LWLLFLELILDWEKFAQKNLASSKESRIVAVGIVASVPIVYVIGVNFLGPDQMLIEIGEQTLTFWHFSLDNLQHWPISLEYLVFTIFFATTIWLAYEFEGLKQFSISLCLLGVIDAIYMIHTFYPYGTFTPFQAFVLFTVSLAAEVLNWMGYQTFLMPYQMRSTPVLYVSGSSGSVGFGIGWPCACMHALAHTSSIFLE